MLDIIDPDPEAVMANEEAADDTLRPGEIHRHLRPEEAVQQIVGTVVQSTVEFVDIESIEYMLHLGDLPDATEHLLESHGELEQGRESCFARQDEVEVIGDVPHPKAEVFLVR